MKLLILCLITLPLQSCVIRTTYGNVTFKPKLTNQQDGKTSITPPP